MMVAFLKDGISIHLIPLLGRFPLGIRGFNMPRTMGQQTCFGRPSSCFGLAQEVMPGRVLYIVTEEDGLEDLLWKGTRNGWEGSIWVAWRGLERKLFNRLISPCTPSDRRTRGGVP